MKTVTDFKIEYTEKNSNMGIPVIIVAAGSSTRMKGVAKQFITLCGIPAIAHTLSAFENSNRISDIILVTKEDYIADMQEICQKYCISKLKCIVVGGVNRQESVKNGINQLVQSDKFVLIHDGARVLVTDEIIANVADNLGKYDCVVSGAAVTDTVKKLNDNGEIIGTIDRSKLFSAQTPQGVNVELYKKLLESANLENFTDDAGLFENARIPVKTVLSDTPNLKITTQADIAIAEFYLENRGGKD